MQCGSLMRCQLVRQAYGPFVGWPSCIAPDQGHARLRVASCVEAPVAAFSV